jgi:hypothetical protein
MKTKVQVRDVWDQHSHIYYEILHEGLKYILSKQNLDIYLAKNNLMAEIKIDHRYPCWYDKSSLIKD